MPKLGEPVPSYKTIGVVSEYFVKKYNFNPNCKVIAFSGDNPCSLIGAGKMRREIVISLGTSDTLFTLRKDVDLSKFNIFSHIFVSPEDENKKMIMLCTKNGALTREHYRDLYADGKWEEFERKINETEPGNDGIIGFFYKFPEIIPYIQKKSFMELYRCGFKKKVEKIEDIKGIKESNILRALVEGKIMSLYNSIVKCGISEIDQILLTGGGAKSTIFPQIISDVFNNKVYSSDVDEGACYGAVIRAIQGDLSMNEKPADIDEILKGSVIDKSYKLIAEPISSGLYVELINSYSSIEKTFESSN